MFDELRQKNSVTWTSLLTGYAQKGLVQKVKKIFCMMLFEGVEPNPFTFATLLGALADEGVIEAGMQVHAMVIKNSFDLTMSVGNSLVSLYSKSGMVREARNAFDSIECKEVASWNGMLAGLVMNGLEFFAMELFHRLRHAGVNFTEVTYTIAINLYANTKYVGLSRQIHCQVVKNGINSFGTLEQLLWCLT